MTKIELVYLISFPVAVIILFCMMLGEYKALPEDKPADINDVPIAQVTARAFNEYGTDANGIAYWHGYVVVSSQSEIPINALLDIDVYGEAQVMAKSSNLAKDEVLLWYQAPSDVENFGQQTAWVRIVGMGENYR